MPPEHSPLHLIIGLALMIHSAAYAAVPADQPAFQPDQPAGESWTDASAISIASIPAAPDSTTSSIEVRNALAANDVSAAPADLWERMRNGFAMPKLDSEEVHAQEDLYISHPASLQLIVKRGRRYLFHILEEVERRDMPAEIALLPFIESAFNPRAYSNRHASGIWQIIPATGLKYGLKQDWWYDGRRDIVAATHAALDYLQNLYRIFGDWHLVLASYNWGQGAVERSRMRNRDRGLPDDFYSIALPAETQSYVPKLIAIRNIISHPEIFGIEIESVPNEPYFAEVTATRPMDVRLAARLADISVEEFRALNPAHKRPVINMNGTRTLLFPAAKVKIFEKNLRNHDQPLVSWQPYRVKEGETVEDISARYGISAHRLKEINDIAASGPVAAGQPLLVPRIANAEGTDIPATLRMPANGFIYSVKEGDALPSIARRYGITVAQIKSWNGNSEPLRIGQKLILRYPVSPGMRLPASEGPIADKTKRM